MNWLLKTKIRKESEGVKEKTKGFFSKKLKAEKEGEKEKEEISQQN